MIDFRDEPIKRWGYRKAWAAKVFATMSREDEDMKELEEFWHSLFNRGVDNHVTFELPGPVYVTFSDFRVQLGVAVQIVDDVFDLQAEDDDEEFENIVGEMREILHEEQLAPVKPGEQGRCKSCGTRHEPDEEGHPFGFGDICPICGWEDGGLPGQNSKFDTPAQWREELLRIMRLNPTKWPRRTWSARVLGKKTEAELAQLRLLLQNAP